MKLFPLPSIYSFYSRFLLSIFLTVGCIFFNFEAKAEVVYKDVVADLDWTLINPTTEKMALADPTNIIRYQNEYYRLSDYAIEFLIELHQQPDVRVSFFSGGVKERNEFVIKYIYEQIFLKTQNSNYRPYKVLSFEHLLQVSKDESLRFWERYKKDLSKHFNLKWVLIIDDIREFVAKGQEANMLWLGKTYNDRPRFNLAHLEDPETKAYSAPNASEYKRNRNKILIARNIIMSALAYSRKHLTNFVDSYQKVIFIPHQCSGIF